MLQKMRKLYAQAEIKCIKPKGKTQGLVLLPPFSETPARPGNKIIEPISYFGYFTSHTTNEAAEGPL